MLNVVVVMATKNIPLERRRKQNSLFCESESIISEATNSLTLLQRPLNLIKKQMTPIVVFSKKKKLISTALLGLKCGTRIFSFITLIKKIHKMKNL